MTLLPRPRRPVPETAARITAPLVYSRMRFPAHSFFGSLDRVHREALLSMALVHRLEKGASENLFSERAVMVVLRGILKEAPIAGGPCNTKLRTAGDILESSAVFDPTGGNITVHGVQSTVLVSVSRRGFVSLLGERPRAMAALARSMAQREKLDLFVNVHVRQGNTSVRIARYLCFLTDFLGEAVGDGVRISGFSQTDIADAVGASRASVENFFREQRRAGTVTTAYRVIDVVDPTELRAQVGNMPNWQR
ncbi:Crp/Fnr family transcriptional regulator [Embleya scabrispora]|uniref:Crp/Fnr family transcriptional regulator n=1 Tax=Embleya scabrispora TaxID=159449 RepID=UPI00131A2182|nr:helix-turn-helix domain-containing protein [Embleya scabrispora]MYS83502.1 helix-turn-helix domain-containing protein [Streptomyces sp. SID5474]